MPGSATSAVVRPDKSITTSATTRARSGCGKSSSRFRASGAEALTTGEQLMHVETDQQARSGAACGFMLLVALSMLVLGSEAATAASFNGRLRLDAQGPKRDKS